MVGGAAPADCLAGKGCVGDARMAALAIEVERLGKDAAGVRNILEAEETARGKPYTAEERAKRVAELEKTLASIGASTDPLRQEAKRLIGERQRGGWRRPSSMRHSTPTRRRSRKPSGWRRRSARRRRKVRAIWPCWRAGGTWPKRCAYYKRATRLDPSDAGTWGAYARAALEAGRTGEAKTAFEQAVAKAGDGGNPYWRYWAMLGLGDVAVAQGYLGAARRHYEAAAAIADPIAKADPGNAGWQRDLSVSHNKIGDVLVEQGNLPAALDVFKAALAIAERLAKADPGNAGWQRDLSVSHNKIGDVLVEQGNLPAALDVFKAALAIAERLAKADPGNAGWQRDLSVSNNKIGDVLRAQGNLPAALDAFKAALAIRERLAKADPGNAGWQRDLSVSHNKIGDVLRAQGNLPAALDAFKAALAIAERLAKADPGNAGRQRDLSVSHNKIGDVLVEQGNLPAVLDAFKVALAMAERLAKADPGNAGWQRDLSVSNNKIGDVLRAQGNLPIEHVADHAVGELGLEPGGLGRHDAVGVRHRHHLLHLRGIEREGHRHLARVRPAAPARPGLARRR